MSQKAFSILVILIAILMVGYLAFNVHDKEEYPVIDVAHEIKFSIEKVIFKVPDTHIETTVHKTDITDSTQRYLATFTDPHDESVRGTISIIDEYQVYIASDKTKVLVPMVVNFGGSGQFVYIAYITYKAGIFEHVNSVFVGDRISIDNINVSPISSDTAGPEAAIVQYKERSRDQSFAEDPILDSQILLQVQNGVLQEQKRIVNGDFIDVRLEALSAYTDVPNKFVIRGAVPGPWYFEANLPIVIEDTAGNIIHQTFAMAKSEWMTTDHVPFESLIILPKDLQGLFKLVIKNDNPSDIAERDKYFELYLNAI